MAKEINNDDLLSMLGAEETTPSVEVVDNTEEDTERKEKVESSIDAIINQIAERTDNKVEVVDEGTGDTGEDYNKWIDGKSMAPSTDLNQYVSNVAVKMNYGLSHSTLSNYKLMNKLRDFLEGSMDMLFSEDTYLNLMPDELENRVKTAFTMYKELANLNQKTTLALSEQAKRYNVDSDVDKLSMLLASIPSDKLSEILKEINKARK